MAKTATTKEKAPKKEGTSVAKTSGIEAFEATKAILSEAANAALQIKVIDESSLGIANQRLSAINSQLKIVEDKRKELKAPHLAAGTAIDTAAKELSTIGDAAITHLKGQIKDWNLALIKKQQEEQAEKQRLEKQAEQEAYDKKCADYLAKIKGWLEAQFAAVDSIEKCDSLLGSMGMVQPVDQMGKFQVEYTSLLNMYGTLIRTKKGELEGKIAKGTTESHIQVLGNQLNNQIEAVVKEELNKVHTSTETYLPSSNIETQMASNVRYSWKFELVDIEKVPVEWMCLNEAKVKEYMKENKDNLQEGQTINGIKFTKDFNVVSR